MTWSLSSTDVATDIGADVGAAVSSVGGLATSNEGGIFSGVVGQLSEFVDSLRESLGGEKDQT